MSTFVKDNNNNIYYCVTVPEIRGALTQLSNDTGMLLTSFNLTDDMIDDMLANAEICMLKKWIQSYKPGASQDIGRFQPVLGTGASTGTEYEGESIIRFVFTDTTRAERFRILTTSQNITTASTEQTYTQNVLNYDFVSAVCAVIRVAIVDTDGSVKTVGIYWIDKTRFEDGAIINHAYSLPTVGAGYLSNGDPVRCTSENEDMLFKSSDYAAVEQDNTPDTEPGGGWGDGTNPTDDIVVPDLPDIPLNITGTCLYALDKTQMSAFTAWLWTSDWIENIKKIRTDPAENIIGLSIIDLDVSGTSGTIKVGNLDSNVAAYLAPRWVQVDCGSISVSEFYGTFADYSPYVNTTLYLPKVGFVSIPADLIVNNTIRVKYNIELSSGEGICYVVIVNNREGFEYIYNTYSCNAAANLPLSASDHSQQIIATANLVAGLATTAMSGAAAPAIASTAVSGALDVASAKNPTTTRGALGNMSALMSRKKPYLMIEATYLTKPTRYRESNGHALYATWTLGDLNGYVQTIDFTPHFDAPADVLRDIGAMLDGGVYIDDSNDF